MKFIVVISFIASCLFLTVLSCHAQHLNNITGLITGKVYLGMPKKELNRITPNLVCALDPANEFDEYCVASDFIYEYAGVPVSCVIFKFKHDILMKATITLVGHPDLYIVTNKIRQTCGQETGGGGVIFEWNQKFRTTIYDIRRKQIVFQVNDTIKPSELKK